MRRLKLVFASIVTVVASTASVAVPVLRKDAPTPTYTNKAYGDAKSPIIRKFLAEQGISIEAAPGARELSGPRVRKQSANCELTPDDQECGGVVSSWWEWPYYDDNMGSYEMANVELEQVVVNGKSMCSSTVTTNYGAYTSICGVIIESAPAFAGMDSLEIGGIKEWIDAFKEVLPDFTPKKLERCVYDQEIASSYPGWNLTRDKREGYSYANQTFMKIYGRGIPGIHNLQRIDVKYPDGFIFTFNIGWINTDPPSVNLFNPVLNEERGQGNNNCAP